MTPSFLADLTMFPFDRQDEQPSRQVADAGNLEGLAARVGRIEDTLQQISDTLLVKKET